MNRSQIEAMEPSFELDRLVAEHVMDWRWYSGFGKNSFGDKVFHFGPPDYEVPEHWRRISYANPRNYAGKKVEADMGTPPFSTDLDAAWKIFRRTGPKCFSISQHEAGRCTVRIVYANRSSEATSPSPQLSICRAALLAYLEEP